MVAWKLPLLLLLQSLAVIAKDEIDDEVNMEEINEPSISPADLKVAVTASFPQSEIFGIKLVNGHATQAVLSFVNSETEPVNVVFIGGSLVTMAEPPVNVRNLTVTRYGVEIPAGESQTITYSFATELHPQDLRLQLVAMITDAKSAFYTVQAYNGTVSVVEAPTSIFDPQIIFLYLVLAGAFGGTCYFVYSTWITTLFPQKRRSDGSRSKTPRKKPVEAPEPGVDPASPPAITSGAKAYDVDWIPPQHLNRPEAKRVGSGRSGTPKTKTRA